MAAKAALKIRDIRLHPVIAPLRAPVTTASGALTEAPLLLIDVETEEGITGRAYLVAYNRMFLAPLQALVRTLGDAVRGDAIVPAEIEHKLRSRFTLLGGTRGLGGIAISGIDMALWDALGQAAGLPLAVMLGGRRKPLRAYNSLGMIAAARIPEEAAKALEHGFKAIKFKIGWPTLAEDIAAVRAFRKAVPDGIELMVDFNQSLSVPEAIRRGRALDDDGLAWMEEPVRNDDHAGCAQVAAALKTPVQIGENFAGPSDMQAALAAGACDLVMPDVQQIGGVSGWLRATALAQASGKPCSSHIFIEASAHLLAVTPTFHYLEYLDLAGAVLSERTKVVGGTVTASDRPGIGITWDMDAVKRFTAA
jgi:mandelate racemase